MNADEPALRSGWTAHIPLRTAPHRSDDELDQQYERLRLALQRYEDAVDPPLTVTLTREAPDTLGEDDLHEALATCREALVDVLGVSADAADVTWRYAQRATADEALGIEVRLG